MSGFTLSYRDKWTHPVFRNLLEAAIWAWLCDTAVWKKTKIRYNGKLVELERGQLVTSIRFMATGFCIGEQVTRTFLENLENEGMVNTQPTHRGTIITICNYNKYQINEETPNTQSNKQVTHSQHTGNTNKKELNKGNEDKELIDTAVNEWNALAERNGLSSCQKVTASRKSSLLARLKDAGGIEGWKAALEKIEASDWCLGRKGTWKANIDFVLQESSFTKLMEGAYDNHSKPTTRDSTIDQLREWVVSGGQG